MSRYDLLKAIGNVDEESVREAKETSKEEKNNITRAKHRTRPIWIKWGSIAACFCLILIATVFAVLQMPNGGEMGPDQGNSDGAENKPNGNLIYLNAECKTSTFVNGTSVKYTGNLSSSSTGDGSPPAFRFEMGYIAVVAKAIEELPSVYQTLNEYGSIYTYRYRVFKFEVIDPLDSGFGGTFYYALPEHLKGDLTKYDALLVSMDQRGNNFIMLNTETNELTSFSTMFCAPYNAPELGNIIAFTDNVFDESLWQDESWLYGYQFARHQLDEGEGYDGMLVYRGSTLEDALNMRKSIKEDWGVWDKSATVNMYDFKTDAAKEAMAFVHPFENGVFVPLNNFTGLKYYRYIGGCPTNEWIWIKNLDTEEVERSEYSFADGDFENLPDIAAYIDSLDLTSIKPQHTNISGKKLLSNSAIGWYEKTEDGVYSIVRISWRHSKDGDYSEQYYDETFIILDDTGARVVSREELIDMIGDNQNIYYDEYGVGIEMPQ